MATNNDISSLIDLTRLEKYDQLIKDHIGKELATSEEGLVNITDLINDDSTSGRELIATAINKRNPEAGIEIFSQFADMAKAIEEIKSSSGNATSDKVLEGFTFSNDSGEEQTGTMVNRTGVDTQICGYESCSVQPNPTDASQAYVTFPNAYENSGYFDASSSVSGSIANLNAANIKAGIAVGRYGEDADSTNTITGTFTSDATATASQILAGATAYVNGNKVDGTMPNNPAYTHDIPYTAMSDEALYVGIPNGAYLQNGGSNYPEIIITIPKLREASPTLTDNNIKAGVKVMGVTGTFTSDANATAANILSGKTAYVNGNKITGSISSKGAATITPGTSNQTINAGYYLSGAQTILGSSNLISSNIKSGVNIFGVIGNVSAADNSVYYGGGTEVYFAKTVNGYDFYQTQTSSFYYKTSNSNKWTSVSSSVAAIESYIIDIYNNNGTWYIVSTSSSSYSNFSVTSSTNLSSFREFIYNNSDLYTPYNGAFYLNSGRSYNNTGGDRVLNAYDNSLNRVTSKDVIVGNNLACARIAVEGNIAVAYGATRWNDKVTYRYSTNGGSSWSSIYTVNVDLSDSTSNEIVVNIVNGIFYIYNANSSNLYVSTNKTSWQSIAFTDGDTLSKVSANRFNRRIVFSKKRNKYYLTSCPTLAASPNYYVIAYSNNGINFTKSNFATDSMQYINILDSGTILYTKTGMLSI